MDLWVVAAAAGAGCLAKYWNRVLKNDNSSCHLASEDSCLENPGSPSCPFPFPKEAGKDELGKEVKSDRRWGLDGMSLDLNTLDGVLTRGVASNKGLDSEKIRNFQNYNKSEVLSISNLAVSPCDDNFRDVRVGNDQSCVVGNHGFFLPDSSVEVVPIRSSSGHNTCLRTKRLFGHVGRPLSSLESCFLAQLYNEHAEAEEYVFSSLSSPSTVTRPFLVSNGSRIINRADNNLFGASIGSKEYKLHREPGLLKDENAFGVPFLPKIGLVNDATKMQVNAVIGRLQGLSSSNDVLSRKHLHTQCDTTFLFSLGISFGMVISITTNKREIDKLKESLKQMESLVQDLQEELEMKDSMTVKELHTENYGSQDTCGHSSYDKDLNVFSPEKHMDNSPRNTIDSKELSDQKMEQSSESISKIEAELEAELERLGLDMNVSNLERKLSELVELDPEFVADFAQGELCTASGKDFVHLKSNEDASDHQTPLPGNYAVSPHELSLRLHEVLQSQLEQRVKELEISLENSQRKVRILESKHEGYFEQATSFSGGNEDCDPMSQPLILNLSGEALDAYNEAYDELIKINDSDGNSPSSIHYSDSKEGSHSSHDWHALGVQHGATEDESFGFDNEVEQKLIKQIVEMTKKGSPVFKNAQRILNSMDEDEH